LLVCAPKGAHRRVVARGAQHGKARQVLRRHGDQEQRHTQADQRRRIEGWHDEFDMRQADACDAT
jgi:hypothetical protein